MANLSDASGTITVKKVGLEFIEYIRKAQIEAYYLLVEDENLDDIKIGDNGDITIDFSTSGRWNYFNNIEGYILGTWMSDKKEAYDKFINALKAKNGSVEIDYTDSDTGIMWVGKGTFKLSARNGELQPYEYDFEENDLTIANYAEINGEDEYWALEYIYGDEVSSKYDAYVKSVGTDKILTPAEWFDNIYEEED